MPYVRTICPGSVPIPPNSKYTWFHSAYDGCPEEGCTNARILGIGRDRDRTGTDGTRHIMHE
jgi:hypothetical protein